MGGRGEREVHTMQKSIYIYPTLPAKDFRIATHKGFDTVSMISPCRS